MKILRENFGTHDRPHWNLKGWVLGDLYRFVIKNCKKR